MHTPTPPTTFPELSEAARVALVLEIAGLARRFARDRVPSHAVEDGRLIPAHSLAKTDAVMIQHVIAWLHGGDAGLWRLIQESSPRTGLQAVMNGSVAISFTPPAPGT